MSDSCAGRSLAAIMAAISPNTSSGRSDVPSGHSDVPPRSAFPKLCLSGCEDDLDTCAAAFAWRTRVCKFLLDMESLDFALPPEK